MQNAIPASPAALEPGGAISAVYLFGRRARGMVTRLSDIDIAILFNSTIEESDYFTLMLDYTTRIMEMLHTQRVDAVVLNEAPLHLAHELVSRGPLLLDRDPEPALAGRPIIMVLWNII